MDNGAPWRAIVTYRKVGRLRFLSHLDVARAMERAIRRAQWPVAYTKGFHQRMRISLGPPLPVGAEGEAELMAVALVERVPDEWALSTLRLKCHPDLAPVSVALQPSRAQPPLKLIRRASYIVELAPGSVAPDEVARAVAEMLSAERIPLAIEEGRRTLDLRPRIYSACVGEGLPVRLRINLGVAEDNYLSPDRFLEGLSQFLHCSPPLRWSRLVR
ncbi:MAG: DUF2344 domain-containing protein, partial [Armatimonadetes bacterium]|nr:DUF2344 domain-containing protein [Armatimonadota bacterium]